MVGGEVNCGKFIDSVVVVVFWLDEKLVVVVVDGETGKIIAL